MPIGPPCGFEHLTPFLPLKDSPRGEGEINIAGGHPQSPAIGDTPLDSSIYIPYPLTVED